MLVVALSAVLLIVILFLIMRPRRLLMLIPFSVLFLMVAGVRTPFFEN